MFFLCTGFKITLCKKYQKKSKNFDTKNNYFFNKESLKSSNYKGNACLIPNKMIGLYKIDVKNFDSPNLNFQK